MSAEAIATVTEMMRTLPDATQNHVADYLRNYIADLQEDSLWDESFAKTQPRLEQFARLAKQQIADGKAKTLNVDDL